MTVSRRWFRAVWVGLGLGASGCAREHGGAAGDRVAAADTAAAVQARTVLATRGPFTQTVSAIGVVTPRPERLAQLAAPAPTRVARIFVSLGEVVQRGAPLVEFDRAPFEAQARSAQAALTAAQRNHDRAQTLVDEGIMPRKDLDQAASELAQARSSAIAAQRASDLATLRAPIAGVVTRLNAVLSAPADPAQSVVEIADPSVLDVVFAVSGSDAAALRVGTPVTVWADQEAAGAPLASGVLASVGVMVDSGSRGIPARARLSRPAHPLRLGETVFGRLTSSVHRDAVTVPLEALVPEGDGFIVFRLDSARVAHATPVTVGGRQGGRAEIIHGLAGGETIAAAGAYGIADGARIVPLGSADTTSRP